MRASDGRPVSRTNCRSCSVIQFSEKSDTGISSNTKSRVKNGRMTYDSRRRSADDAPIRARPHSMKMPVAAHSVTLSERGTWPRWPPQAPPSVSPAGGMGET